VTGETEVSINVWWPGVSNEADDDAITETVYGINVLDMQGKPLPLSRISKKLIGSSKLCATEGEENDNTDEDKAAEEPAKEEAVPEATNNDNTCTEEVNEGCSNTSESNENSIDDQTNIETTIQPPIDEDTIKHYLQDQNFTLESDGTLLVWFQGQLHSLAFSTVLSDEITSTERDELALMLAEDFNHDGYCDYIVTYPGGQRQVVLYLGVVESTLPKDKDTQNTDQEVPSATSPTSTVPESSEQPHVEDVPNVEKPNTEVVVNTENAIDEKHEETPNTTPQTSSDESENKSDIDEVNPILDDQSNQQDPTVATVPTAAISIPVPEVSMPEESIMLLPDSSASPITESATIANM
jgi:hypothetical protein